MKNIFLFACVLLFTAPAAQAVYPVQDISLIRTNILNARRDLAEQILQGTRQVQQIKALYERVQQAQTHLERLGDPRKVTLETVEEALDFLKLLNLSLNSEGLTQDVRGAELFERGDAPLTGSIPRSIVINGEAVADTDASVFLAEAAAHRANQHYEKVRDTALENRARIKAAMSRTLQQVQHATTSSEVQKLGIVLRSLESQLAANDREIDFASSAQLAAYLRQQNEKDIAAKLTVQREREGLRVSTERDLRLYEISTKTVPFKR